MHTGYYVPAHQIRGLCYPSTRRIVEIGPDDPRYYVNIIMFLVPGFS